MLLESQDLEDVVYCADTERRVENIPNNQSMGSSVGAKAILGIKRTLSVSLVWTD